MMTDRDLREDHYLTRELGWRSVDEMRAGMSMAEYEEHRAFRVAVRALRDAGRE